MSAADFATADIQDVLQAAPRRREAAMRIR